jgi:hypothetical protein
MILNIKRKGKMDKKILLSLLIGGTVIILGGGALFYSQNMANKNGTNNGTTTSDDFQKMGQYSFGVKVCDEMTKQAIADAIGKQVLTVTDYSNSTGTGCQYHTEPNNAGTVSVNVAFGEANKSKTASEYLGRKVGTESSIGLENFTVYSSSAPTEIMDIYLIMDPMQKYVRVSKHSAAVVDNATLIILAKRTEEKIRSYK